MKRFTPTLLIFPVLGALLLFGAYLFNATALHMLINGEREPGRIAAMVKLRADDADLITALEHTVILTRSDGQVLSVDLRDYVPVSARLGEQPVPLDALAGNEPANFPGLSAETGRTVITVAQSEAAGIRRVLKRETRNKSPERIERIEKIEIAHGWLGLPRDTRLFSASADGHVNPANSTTSAPHVVRTRAVFASPSKTNPTSGKDVMIEYDRTRDGEASQPAKRDFILFSEPYPTVARPVFSFTAPSGPQAILSDLGRRGAPSLAFPLFAPCVVAFDPARPDLAVLLADVGQPNAKIGYLNWFSKAGEGIFTRWAYLVILVAGGLTLLAVGLILITLAYSKRQVSPPKAHTPSP